MKSRRRQVKSVRSITLVLSLLSSCVPMVKPQGHEECSVCKANGDLACLYVKPKPETPSVTVDGKVHHFCSEDCRQEFLKHRDEYIEK
jgi:YHS domain-containing protein